MRQSEIEALRRRLRETGAQYEYESPRRRFSLDDDPHLVEVRVCNGGPDYRIIKLAPVEAGWRYAGCSGGRGTFTLPELVEAVQRAREAPQPPRWIAALRVAPAIRSAKRSIDYRIGSEDLWCRYRKGLFGPRVEFTTNLRYENLYRISIKYRKLKKVVRTLNSIQPNPQPKE